jgi:glycine/D-amino acid oxidase-like deaminating enzyme
VTKYGRSPWIDRFPKSRVPSLPRYRGPLKIDAVIIGGGLTGCATAYAFAAAGVKTILLEAAQIGRGNSGSSLGWISEDPGTRLVDLERTLGVRRARLAWQAWRRGALDFATLLRRLGVKTGFAAQPSLTIATTPDQAARLVREQQARRKANLDAPLLKAAALRSELGLDAAAGVRAKEGAIVDPYRACLALASAAAERGATLYERSPVRKITFTRKTADVITDAGTIRTGRVIVATGMPTPLFSSLARHFWFRTTYLTETELVPARIRHALGRRAAIVRDSAEPPHAIRWLGGDRLLINGADGDSPPPRLRDKTIVQRTGQLMYELSMLYPDISGIQPEYGWAADYARTADGLPCIGAHRNFPHHLFAFADASHTITGAYLASRIMLRQHFEEMDPVDEVFGFHR